MVEVTIYGNDVSPPAMSARMVAESVGVGVNLIRMYPLNGQCRSPDYLKINPMHTIPTMIDNQFLLSESPAIGCYLSDKYGKDDKLYPKDIQKRAVVNERLHYLGTLFGRIANTFGAEFLGHKRMNDEQKAQLIDALETVERILSSNTWIAGSSQTIADYYFYIHIDYLRIIGDSVVDLSPYSHIKKWLELAEKTDPIYKKYGEMFRKAFQTMKECGYTKHN